MEGGEKIADVVARVREGDEVLLEEDGKIVARVRPEPRHTDWKAYFERRATEPPLDDEFEEIIRQIVAEGNKPAEDIDWAF